MHSTARQNCRSPELPLNPCLTAPSALSLPQVEEPKALVTIVWDIVLRVYMRNLVVSF
jgi:hypothetical protein